MVEEVLAEVATPMPAVIADLEPHDDCDSHNIAPNKNTQVHLVLSDPSGLETIASISDISHQLTNSYETPAKSTQRSGIQPSRLLGLIFFLHIGTPIAVIVMFNFTTTAGFAGGLLICFILSSMLRREGVDIYFAIRIQLAAMMNSTPLDKYGSNEPTADEGSNEPASQSNRAAQASALDDVGLHVRDTMIETSIANAANNSKERSKQNPGYDPSALQTVLQGQEIQEDAGNENRLFIRPSRQDTETGLRG